MMEKALWVGIFVGGASSRMGGAPKGLLAAPDTTVPLVERLAAVAREACDGAHVVLVGEHAAYREVGLPVLRDNPPNIGPLGGLCALLEAAGPVSHAMALACDLPFLTAQVVARVARAAPDALAVAPKTDGIWQPLCARYSPRDCLPVARRLVAEKTHGLCRLLDALGTGAVPLLLDDGEAGALQDWDTPEDMEGRVRPRNP